jgi:hypothetical protein
VRCRGRSARATSPPPRLRLGRGPTGARPDGCARRATARCRCRAGRSGKPVRWARGEAVRRALLPLRWLTTAGLQRRAAARAARTIPALVVATVSASASPARRGEDAGAHPYAPARRSVFCRSKRC